MGLSPWRQRAKRIIEHALAQLPIGASYRAKRQALREAYPFGERANHPYRIWCEECTKAIGAKTKPKQVAPVVSVSPLGVECGWCQAASDRQGRWTGGRGARADRRASTLLPRKAEIGAPSAHI